MAPIWFGSWFSTRTRWEKIALIVWTVVLLVVSVRVFVQPNQRTVYPIYSASARLWWNSDELYEPYRPSSVQLGYRYSPTFAILGTPFAIFPDAFGGVLWRLFSTAALLGSLVRVARSVSPMPLSRDQIALLTLLSLPLSLPSVVNGQVNLIVIATLLATVAAVKDQRWNLACILITLAFVCKIYPLALGLLLAMLYPRQLLWRLPIALAASLLAPFLLQRPDYVIDQYQKWTLLLHADDRTTSLLTDRHRDLWLLIDLYGLPISRQLYTVLQLAGGAGIAALCWWRQRCGWSETALLTSTLALAVTWMLVLGPVVESSTFVMLAPSLAWSILATLQTNGWTGRKWLLAASVGLFILAVLSGSIANTAQLHLVGVHSWASLLYFVYLLSEPAPTAVQPTQQSFDLRAAA